MQKTLEGHCESCLLPFAKDPQGKNREHEKYCSYCFRNGKLRYEGTDVNEFKKAMIADMVGRGESKIKAHFFAFLSGFAPRWKKN